MCIILVMRNENDPLEAAARKLVGWRLTVSEYYEVCDATKVIADGDLIVGAWVVPYPWVGALPVTQRPKDPRLIRCVVESGFPVSEHCLGYPHVDHHGDEHVVHVQQPRALLLHFDLPSSIAGAVASVALGWSEPPITGQVRGEADGLLDFQLCPPGTE